LSTEKDNKIKIILIRQNKGIREKQGKWKNKSRQDEPQGANPSGPV
jgi:hypothetical protein